METSWARIYEGFGYMYVAPRKVPTEIRAAGFRMITSRDEEIVIARHYLSGGEKLDLYLDVIHEFLHILQRKAGRELWPGVSVPYVERPTELEAYAFSIEEARRLGVSDAYLRKYLQVEWVSPADHRRLLERLGLSSPPTRAKSSGAAALGRPRKRRLRS